MLFLKPLRLHDQIKDAIQDYTPPELAVKIQTCEKYKDQISHINGDPVQGVTIKKTDLFYTLPGKPGRFFYPVQYAAVKIDRGKS